MRGDLCIHTKLRAEWEYAGNEWNFTHRNPVDKIFAATVDGVANIPRFDNSLAFRVILPWGDLGKQ